MKVLINASNLHVGGGVQVASSFISDLYRLGIFDFHIICSSKVFENLSSDVDVSLFHQFSVCDVYGIKWNNSFKDKLNKNYQVCFTVFGPFYHKVNSICHICGFAQPWIAFADDNLYKKLNFFKKIKFRLKFKLQELFFRRYELLVVEHQGVKRALIKKGFSEDKIEVISNTVSSIFELCDCWQPINIPQMRKSDVCLGFIGYPYEHKNILILKDVVSILYDSYSINANVLLTLTDDEMNERGFDEHRGFYSVGAIRLEQCPNFYKSIDFLIFPSLLECFSASPIEAFKMNIPVLASEREFVQGVCDNAVVYFDPLDAADIAKKVAYLFNSKLTQQDLIKKGNVVSESLPSSLERTESFLDLINSKLIR